MHAALAGKNSVVHEDEKKVSFTVYSTQSCELQKYMTHLISLHKNNKAKMGFPAYMIENLGS